MIPSNTAAVRALPGGGVGVASGILSMLRQMGAVLGVAVLVATLSMQYPHMTTEACSRTLLLCWIEGLAVR